MPLGVNIIYNSNYYYYLDGARGSGERVRGFLETASGGKVPNVVEGVHALVAADATALVEPHTGAARATSLI